MKIFLFLLFLLAIVLVLRFVIQRVIVFDFEKGLKYVEGRFSQVLSSGGYWHFPYFITIRKIDMRPKFVFLGGQEVLSSDSIALKVSVAAKYQVDDPQKAVNAAEDYEKALYLELQLGLREILSAATIDEILEKRNLLAPQLFELKKEKIAELGLSLLSVDIKDIMFPGDLKRIFAQVVKAKKDGQAALEKARAETATLRRLANASQLLERNPNLMQLRMLQALEESSGNTIVFGMSPQMTPLPLKVHETNSSDSRPGEEADED
ncbi:MAG: slipin family protein [Candidatus Binatia bacterium]